MTCPGCSEYDPYNPNCQKVDIVLYTSVVLPELGLIKVEDEGVEVTVCPCLLKNLDKLNVEYVKIEVSASIDDPVVDISNQEDTATTDVFINELGEI